ncbi:hypothetical protein ALC57_11791 [Trachymyrmex cornetzi]|uniref:Uncharacterized protein n=1 Tax=Trachymyrmex cornetzi TaxID=471704 RepID=A0A151K450_9HYME|nr:hypothetical protein ALC57_11791 [Trachymyrmex cornetzi]
MLFHDAKYFHTFSFYGNGLKNIFYNFVAKKIKSHLFNGNSLLLYMLSISNKTKLITLLLSEFNSITMLYTDHDVFILKIIDLHISEK